MARMLGRAYPPQCPVCRAEPGPDCIGKGKAKRVAKRFEDSWWRREADQDIFDACEDDEEWHREWFGFPVGRRPLYLRDQP